MVFPPVYPHSVCLPFQSIVLRSTLATVLSRFSDRCIITEHKSMERKSDDTLHVDLHRTLNLVKTRSRSFRNNGAITFSLALPKYHRMAGAHLSQSISACGRDEVPPVEGRGSFAAVTLIAPQFVLKQRNTLALKYSGIAIWFLPIPLVGVPHLALDQLCQTSHERRLDREELTTH